MSTTNPFLIAHHAKPPEHYGYVECAVCKLDDEYGNEGKFYSFASMARHLLQHITYGHHVQPATAAIALDADYEYPDGE